MFDDDEIVEFAYAEEPSSVNATTREAWNIVVVDDDEDVHTSTEFACNGMLILGGKLNFIHFYSGKEAIEGMSALKDIGLIFMDVVMETERAGLDAIKHIRQTLHMQNVRIILRTGQPGYAPEQSTVEEYDINDYKVKSELSRMKLFTVLASSLRSYSQLERLSHLLNEDTLTKLQTRNSFLKCLQHQIITSSEYHPVLALLDIDQFSGINEMFGTTNGDNLLIELAHRLETAFSDTVVYIARLHGDVFAVQGTSDKVTPEVLHGISKAPFVLSDTKYKLTLCVGLLDIENVDEDPVTLLRSGEAALKMAKGTGHNSVYHSTSNLRNQTFERMQMLHNLRTDFVKGCLFLVYQPQYSFSTGELTGSEALLRWHNLETNVFVPPDRFIPLAEKSGFIIELGEWVLRTALEEFKQISAFVSPRFKIAVNVSMIQLKQPNFTDLVKKIIVESGVNPHNIALEITESVASLGLSIVQEFIESVHGLGVEVAIDDFGTGFSSLSYLDKLNIDKLKIDKSFVDHITVESRLSETIISMGKKLDMTIIAEGVETQEQVDKLTSLGCDEAQGYFYSRPIELPKFLELIQTKK